jgi:predicted transposase YbfD/YdcC
VPSSLIDELVRQCEEIVLPCPPGEMPGLPTLAQALEAVPDLRRRRGRRYRLAFLLSLAVVAVLGGAKSLSAIVQWARDADEATLTALGAPARRRPARPPRSAGPSNAWTPTRSMTPASAGSMPYSPTHSPTRQRSPAWAWTARPCAARRAPTVRPRIWSPPCTIAGQRQVPAKTNEIKAFAPLLDTIDITGMAITADAMHTQRAHATYLHKRGAFYVFYAMGNQPTLFETLNALDWKAVPIGHADEKIAHGRRELRTIQVRPAPKGLRFPHAAQVFLIERKVSHPKTGKRLSSVAVLGITSLTADHATPVELAALVRGQWTIEKSQSDCSYGWSECGSGSDNRS